MFTYSQIINWDFKIITSCFVCNFIGPLPAIVPCADWLINLHYNIVLLILSLCKELLKIKPDCYENPFAKIYVMFFGSNLFLLCFWSPLFLSKVLSPWRRGYTCFSNRRGWLYWFSCCITAFERFISCNYCGMFLFI